MEVRLFAKLALVAAAVFSGSQCRPAAPAPSFAWKWKPGQERRYRLDLHREMNTTIRQRGITGVLAYEERTEQVWRLKATHLEPDGTVSLEATYEAVKARQQFEENGPFYEFDSRRPKENPANPGVRGLLANVGMTFHIQMWQRGDVWEVGKQPTDGGHWTESSLNLSGFNLSERIVAESFDALFSRWSPREALGDRRSWDLRRPSNAPGMGSTEFLFRFAFIDPKVADDRNLGISESISLTLVKAESRPDSEKGDPENDPFLLHQRITGFSGVGKGEMWFDPEAGHVRRLAESFIDTTTATTGSGTRSLETTLELLPP